MALLPVSEALARILDGATPLQEKELCPLETAAGRITFEPLVAKLTQPPFNASAMDGFAVRADDVKNLPTTLDVIGEAAAGHPFTGQVGPGQAVRIFTGAPVPAGADAIVIQENTDHSPESVTVHSGTPDPAHIRYAGSDFRAGEEKISANHFLTSRDIALIAAMGFGEIPVRRKPRVAILATGDELVPPGTTPGEGQIISSNPAGLAAMIARAGGEPIVLGIAKDTAESLDEKINAARSADVLVTIGGASVGDHDLVASRLQAHGMTLDFWKIAMRPGKPLLFGRMADTPILGVPGNPVSAMICARVFLLPLLQALLGQTAIGQQSQQARLAEPLPANGPRQHYMRATLQTAEDGTLEVRPAASQDSSLLSLLAESNALIVCEPKAPAADAGSLVTVLPLDF